MKPAIVSIRRSVRPLVALGALALLFGSSCGGSDTEPTALDTDVATATEPGFGLVSAATAAALVDDPAIVVVDVRTPAEFEEGHLERAIEIDYNAPDFTAEIEQLDPATTYLVYCRSGSRSAGATKIMRDAGLERLYELDGGIVAWTDAGFEVTTSG